MKCPHCNVEINPDFKQIYVGSDNEGDFSVAFMNCPSHICKKLIIDIWKGEPVFSNRMEILGVQNATETYFVRPISANRPPVPKEVDMLFAEDYNEACLVLPFSTKASAALSRRCLQNVLREKAGVKNTDLSKEIQELIDSRQLPSHLSASVDAIRQIGNFAAHPIKSQTTGQIVPVEYGEAEWLLDVLEALFDFFFVQPALIQAKREALNQKLFEIGKPPMK